MTKESSQWNRNNKMIFFQSNNSTNMYPASQPTALEANTKV